MHETSWVGVESPGYETFVIQKRYVNNKWYVTDVRVTMEIMGSGYEHRLHETPWMGVESPGYETFVIQKRYVNHMSEYPCVCKHVLGEMGVLDFSAVMSECAPFMLL